MSASCSSRTLTSGIRIKVGLVIKMCRGSVVEHLNDNLDLEQPGEIRHVELKAARIVELRHEAEVRDNQHITNKKLQIILNQTILINIQTTINPITTKNTHIHIKIISQMLNHHQILQQLYPKINQLHKLPHFHTSKKINKKQHKLKHKLLKQLHNHNQLHHTIHHTPILHNLQKKNLTHQININKI